MGMKDAAQGWGWGDVCDEYLKLLTAVDLRLMTVSGQHGGDRP